MEKIFFSIIVPVYNVEKYLADCLESILSQSYQYFEVICINDASTDRSYEILSSYAKQYDKIRIIENEVNRGLSCSRNRGIEIAKGDYILFVDSDDYIVEEALEILEDVLKEHPVDILNFNYILKVESEYEKERKIKKCRIQKKDIAPKSGQRWFIEGINEDAVITMAWSKVYKRVFLQKCQLSFYEGLLHEDVLFLIQVFIEARNVLGIDESLYIYRKREGSITATKNEARLDSLVIILGEIASVLKKNVLEAGMEAAVYKYFSETRLPWLRTLMMAFPEHNQLTIGTPGDQFLFLILRNLLNEQSYQYIHINQEEQNIIRNFEKRIIYGAGNVCSELLQYCRNKNISIDYIAVSNKELNMEQIAGYTIQQIDELVEYKEEALVIVAMLKRKQDIVTKKLADLGFKNIFLLDTDREG